MKESRNRGNKDVRETGQTRQKENPGDMF